MAKEIEWESLTPEEAETLSALVNSGKKVFAAPIEIEEDAHARRIQFESLQITIEDCRTWTIGCDKVLVHLTPADEETYNSQLNALRKKHRTAFRKGRCPIPGKQQPLISCPESNSCYNCPFPEYRDMHLTREISWEGLVEDGYEAGADYGGFRQMEVMAELNDVCKDIEARNPKYLKAFVLKEYYGYKVSEIANMMGETERNIYYYLSEAKRIGKQYRQKND